LFGFEMGDGGGAEQLRISGGGCTVVGDVAEFGRVVES
jgi:hypothetical protein